MGDKILLNYKGNLDISDIPGALTGSKMGAINKIQGRDYINVHDIPGAIPKINVGYTGNHRLDEHATRGSYNTNTSAYHSGNTDLIGRPKLKSNTINSSQGAYNNHNRGGSLVIQSNNNDLYNQQQLQAHSNYNLVNGQQVDHSQLYHSIQGQGKGELQNNNDKNSNQNQQQSYKMNRVDLFSQNSLNQRDNSASVAGGYMTQRVKYEDELDKFMSQGQGKNTLQRQDSKINQYKTSIPPQIDHELTPRNRQLQQEQTISGLLTSRNTEVAKSTANLIMKPKQEDDIFSSLGQRRQSRYQQPKQDQALTSRKLEQNNSVDNHSSPNQVQKKIKEIQSTQDQTLHNSSAKFLDQLSSSKLHDTFRHQNNNTKKHALFNINPSTVPDSGHFDIKQSQGLIKRSLNLAPSTSLGQHHKEEIDESIQHREYTKLGGQNLNVQMPSEINNIAYHKHNPMKDYTYSALTGAYYYRAPN